MPAGRNRRRREDMTPDYDLSDLAISQVNLWLHLHTETIRAEILLDQDTCEEPGHSQQRSAFGDWPQTRIPKPLAPGLIRLAREN
jgi:hypothetical protein